MHYGVLRGWCVQDCENEADEYVAGERYTGVAGGVYVEEEVVVLVAVAVKKSRSEGGRSALSKEQTPPWQQLLSEESKRRLKSKTDGIFHGFHSLASTRGEAALLLDLEGRNGIFKSIMLPHCQATGPILITFLPFTDTANNRQGAP